MTSVVPMVLVARSLSRKRKASIHWISFDEELGIRNSELFDGSSVVSREKESVKNRSMLD